MTADIQSWTAVTFFQIKLCGEKERSPPSTNWEGTKFIHKLHCILKPAQKQVMSPREAWKHQGKMAEIQRRRRATQEELRQGEDEMRRAAERMAREASERGEEALEDARREDQVEEVTTVVNANQVSAVALQSNSTEQQLGGPVRPNSPESINAARSGNQQESNRESTTTPGRQVAKTSQPNTPGVSMYRTPVPKTREGQATPKHVQTQRSEPVSKASGRADQTVVPKSATAIPVPGTTPPSQVQQPLFTEEQLRQMDSVVQSSSLLQGLAQRFEAAGMDRPGFLAVEDGRTPNPTASRPEFLRQYEEQIERAAYEARAQSIQELGVTMQRFELLSQENRWLKEKLLNLEQRMEARQEGRFATPESVQARRLQEDQSTSRQAEVQEAVRSEGPQEAEIPNGRSEGPQEAEIPNGRSEGPNGEEIPSGRSEGFQEAESEPRHQGGQQPGDSRTRSTGDFTEKTMEFMSIMVQSMKEMQTKMMEGKDESGSVKGVEVIRAGVPELPLLPQCAQGQGPIQLGDWLLLVEPVVSDLSATSEEWWRSMVKATDDWYQRHQALSPLDRLNHPCAQPPQLQELRWQRLERRVASMLLQSVPEQTRDELVSSRRLSVFAILCHLLLIYCPGGLLEKQTLLKSLEDPNEIQNIADAPTSLRKWMRWKNRTGEIGATMPDAAILMKGLNKMMKRILDGNKELQFRISLARNALGVDVTPTVTNVSQFATHLLAEVEQLAMSEKRVTSAGKNEGPPKIKNLEYEKEDKGKGKGRERPEEEKPRRCKFYLTDSGCRRGKSCTWAHDAKDEKRRCYNCGAVDHMSPSCTRPRADGSPSKAKAVKNETEDSSPKKSETESEAGSQSEGAMKDLLEEASKVLRSLSSTSQGSAASSSTPQKEEEARGDVMERLQQQIQALSKMQQKTFRLFRLATGQEQGLLDSGATHALRPQKSGERWEDLKKVEVVLADGAKAQLRMSSGMAMVTRNQSTEPIVPMGQLTDLLGCEVWWKGGEVQVQHPKRGRLPVMNVSGCPQVPRQLALDLINEIEEVNQGVKRKEGIDEEELKWMKKLLEVHPVLKTLPEWIKEKLIITPGRWNQLPANRRWRKRMKRDGIIVHLFAGPDEGFTLKQAWKQSGGSEKEMLEIDILRGEDHDFLADGGCYAGLLRAVLDSKVRAILGGPNCRTRSVLRHYPIPDQPLAPRPVRAWGGEEYGKKGNTAEEQKMVSEDDVMLWRMIFLAIIGQYMWKARQLPGKMHFELEQPASPRSYMPEVVSFWDQEEWRKLKEEFEWKEKVIYQNKYGAGVAKPTTFGGSLELETEDYVEIRPRKKLVKVPNSKSLARWPPGVMSMLAGALMKQANYQKAKIAELSWAEHFACNHTPYRRDCRVCQESLQQEDQQHRRVKYPQGGVLSIDVAGPFPKAYDKGGGQARYMLIGALTWRIPKEVTKLKPPEDQPEEEGDPVLEDRFEKKRREEKEDSNGDADVGGGGPQQLPLMPPQGDEENEVPNGDADVGGGGPQRLPLMPPEGDEEGQEDEEVEDEKRKREEADLDKTELVVYRLGLPMVTKTGREVARNTMEFLLRLKADGYNVVQIHTDQGHEFQGEFKRWCLSRGIRLTKTPGDDPRNNGRAEQAVKAVKCQVRRALGAAGVDIKWWPWALRYVGEVNRQARIGQIPDFPRFLADVRVRKRSWTRGSLEPNVELAKFLTPSPEDHGYWIVPGEQAPRLTRSLMRKTENPEDPSSWIAVERDVMDAWTVRRRIRGKSTIRRIQQNEEPEESEEDERNQEEKERAERALKVIKEEMRKMVSDDPTIMMDEMTVLQKLKKMSEVEREEDEVLQTKIVSSKEVAKDWSAWLAAIDQEVNSLLHDKEALKWLTEKEYEELMKNAERDGVQVEQIPSKMVFTVKPGPKGGKKKARWVACGNHECKKSSEENYSGGADCTALRVLVWAAQRNQWVACVLDISTAFLNAAMEVKEGESILIIRPPSIFRDQGYMPKTALFLPLKAVYGFRRSPRLWSLHRDKILRSLEIEVTYSSATKEVLILSQLDSEPNLWKIQVMEEGEDEESKVDTGKVRGLLMSYVDDILVTGSDPVVAAVVRKIEETWKVSKPEKVGQEPVRYLGMELRKKYEEEEKREVWYVTQSAYAADWITKDEGEIKPKKIPITRDQSTMEPDEKTPEVESIRECQKEVGEALWLMTRTRPDIMYTVARMGSSITRSTKKVLETAKQLKGYVLATKDEGLRFADKEEEVIIHAFSDASFSPDSEESHGCFVVMVNQCPLFWRSSRQTSITLSTAEAELNELIEAMNGAESVGVMIEELYGGVKKAAWCDNQASISILGSEGGSWRTRHLRMRSGYARQAVLKGEWSLGHLAGESMVADLGTKPLAAVRIEALKKILGMQQFSDEEEKEEKKEKIDFNTESAENAPKVLLMISVLRGVKAQGEEEEEEEGFKWLTLIYTALVIAVTLVVQWMWKAAVRYLEGRRQRILQQGARSHPAEAEGRGEEVRRGEGGSSQSDLVRLPREEREEVSRGEGGSSQSDLVRLPREEEGGEGEAAPGQPDLVPLTPEEEHAAQYVPIAPEDIEAEWDAILREEEEIRAEMNRPYNYYVPPDPDDHSIGFPVLMTRYGEVYHPWRMCNYLTASHVGQYRNSPWCPECRTIALQTRGRPPPGCILYIDGWGEPVHTYANCRRRRTEREVRACAMCMSRER